MFKKNTFPIILFGFIILFLPGTGSASFRDVPSNHRQVKAIENLESQNILKGYPDGTFKPEKLISKAEFFKIIFKSISYQPKENEIHGTGFHDVPLQSWFSGYIKKALDLKLIAGPQTDPYFKPEQTISKLEATRLAFLLHGVPLPYQNNFKPDELFSDTSVDAPFAYISAAAKKYNIVSTLNPTMFTPHKPLTRGDTAELIYQVMLSKDGTTGGSISVAPSEETFEGLNDITTQFINNPKFPILLDVWEKAHQEYFYKENIDQNQLIYGAIKGMVDEMGDPYTVFQDPEGAEDFNNYFEGEYIGIGITLEIIDDQIVITKIVYGSPADKIGMKTGDIIVKVDGQSTDNLSLEEVFYLIQGEENTKVSLSIKRQNSFLEFNVEREKINVSSLYSKMLPQNIAYIKIEMFGSSTAEDFSKTIEKLLPLKPKGFIIDLRDNPGGYFESANDILGHYIEKDKILVYTTTSDNIRTAYTSKGNGELAKFPSVILMNENSASASEIVAGALQDHEIGILLGQKSYGKGSVQKLYSYADNSLLKISIAHWLTPKQKDIQDIGIIPDITVEQTAEAILSGQDAQLNRAILEIEKN